MPEEMRPDRCGAIIMLDRRWRGWAVVKAVPVGESIPEDTLEWLKSHAREKGVPLLFSERLLKDGKFHGTKRLGYGPPRFLSDVENAIGGEDIMVL